MNENIMKIAKRTTIYNGYLITGNVRYQDILTPFEIKLNQQYEITEIKIPTYTQEELSEDFADFMEAEIKKSFGGR